MRIEFFVHGTPQPQGSARAFIPKGWNRAIITSANKSLKPWRQNVADQARLVMDGPPVICAVVVSCTFSFLRPKSLSKRTPYKTSRPDCDKLLRSVLDSMSGIVFRDDAQVIEAHVFKGFTDSPGARITVESR